MSFFKKYAWYGSAVAASALLAVALLLAGPADRASAATTNNVTTTVSLATNIATGSNTFTTLPAITVTCVGVDITAGAANGTLGITLTATAGLSYTGGTVPTVAYGNQSGAGTFAGAATGAIASGTSITITTTGACAATDVVTITGVQVRPANAAPAAAAQTITADIALTDPVAASVTLTNDFYQITTGSTAATATGSSVVTIEQSDIADAFASATFVTTAGTFAANGSSTLFCGDDITSCDVNTGIGAISVQFIAPASGAATITVTPAGGTADTMTVTAQSAAPASVTITAPNPLSIRSSPTAAADDGTKIAVIVRNGAGDALASAVAVSTDRGVLEKSSATACTVASDTNGASANASASCTYTSATGGDTLTLYGNGLAGTATVTITAGTTALGFVTSTTTVALTGGTVSSIELLTKRGNGITAAAFLSRAIAKNVDSTTTGDDELIVVARAKDANGNVITPTGLVTFTIANAAGTQQLNLWQTTAETTGLTLVGTACQSSAGGATCVDDFDAGEGGPTGVGTATHAAAIAYLNIDAADTVATGAYTITAVYDKGLTTEKTATATVSFAGAAATVTVVADATSVEIGASSVLTATVLDSEGNPVTDGSAVTFSVSSGLFTMLSTAGFTCSPTTTAGVASCQALALAAGSGQLFAISGGKTGSVSLTVGAAAPVVTPPATGEGTFDREVPNVGVNTAVYNGGTVEQLSAATAAAGGISVTVFVDGAATVLIPGAPAFVNAAFNAAFADGTVPAGTIVLVVK